MPGTQRLWSSSRAELENPLAELAGSGQAMMDETCSYLTMVLICEYVYPNGALLHGGD